MNGRFEDKLAQLAFGELSPTEAAHVEAQAAKDPEALRTLAMYRSMKGGFSGMRDVPEDQMSKERLRDAILAQGLKPQPVEQGARFGWLWMPATAFVLAAAAMAMMNSQRGSAGPNIVMNEDRIKTPSVEIQEPSIFRSEPAAVAKKATPKQTIVATNDASPRERIRRARVQEQPEEDLAPIELDFPTSIPHMDLRKVLVAGRSDEGQQPTMSVAESTDTAPAASTPIVIIEDNRDESTGAYRATEVGTATNVLIGG
jgi:hypothetical protein